MMPSLLILLLVVRGVGAIACALLGAERSDASRKLALVVTVLDLLLGVVVTAGFLDARASQGVSTSETFQPLIVPGADARDIHATTWKLIDFGELGAVQFYIGFDGLNVWLVLL